MKWKRHLENQANEGRLSIEWKAKILSTAEQAIREYKQELLLKINNLNTQEIINLIHNETI